MFISANIFQPLIDIFDSVMQFFHDSVGLSWGMAIIALTVCVRVVLIPLTFKQFHNMQAMQRLSPEIKALQAKYKDDKPRQQQEMMALYKTHKVNPLSSCLPLVLQLPVFISLFYMLRKDLKVDICGGHGQLVSYAAEHHQTVANTACNSVVPGSAKFGFIPDLTAAATGWVLAVLIVMYILSQLGSSVLMASATADKNQRYLMMALPFVFVFFIIRFPAGLLVYWITTNVWTIGQQYIVRRSVGQLPPLNGPGPPTSGGANGKPPAAEPEDSKASSGNGARATKKEKAAAAAVVAAGPRAAPRPPPRKKKKRSGRRR
jgi:YidC/Oxa1 family membrane protein insertase